MPSNPGSPLPLKKRISTGLGSNDQVIEVLGPLDILFGRGTGPNENPGNKFFRDVVLALSPKFKASKSRVHRRSVISEAIASVQEKGGRFVRKCSTLPDSRSSPVPDATTPVNGSPAPFRSKTTLGPFEVINDATLIRQKVKLAFRYASGEHKPSSQSNSSKAARQANAAKAASTVNSMLLKQHQQQQIQAPQLISASMNAAPSAAMSAQAGLPPSLRQMALLQPPPLAPMGEAPGLAALRGAGNPADHIQMINYLDRQRLLAQESAWALMTESALNKLRAERAALLESLLFDSSARARLLTERSGAGANSNVLKDYELLMRLRAENPEGGRGAARFPTQQGAVGGIFPPLM